MQSRVISPVNGKMNGFYDMLFKKKYNIVNIHKSIDNWKITTRQNPDLLYRL